MKTSKIILSLVVLVIILGGGIYLFNKKAEAYQTYSECVEKTGVPCKFYYMGDIGHAWKPSPYKSKAECDSVRAVGTECIIPPGNFKENRWVDSGDLIMIKNEKTAPITTQPKITNQIEQSTLKKVNLNDQYSIKIPSDYTYVQVTPKITNVPSFEFQSSDGLMRFDVNLLPYIISNTSLSAVNGKTTISSDGNTVYSQSGVLTNSFTTTNGQKVFWGTKSNDLSVGNCTMNSVCPPPPANQRYSITYDFVIADKINSTLIEFWASDVIRTPTPSVTGFVVVAQILHDTIIPSFVSTQTISDNPSIINVFPSGSDFPKNPYPYVVVSWTDHNVPTGLIYSLTLVSADGKNVIGSLANDSKCANTLPSGTQSYNWSVQMICVNLHPQTVLPGKYKIRVMAYLNDSGGADIVGESNEPFTITQ